MNGGTVTGRVRAPAVAGTFYSANPVLLGREVDAYLDQAARRIAGTLGAHGEGRRTVAPVGLVVPHAGLAYSGSVAASAWARLVADPPDTIVVAGTNHSAADFVGVGIWAGAAWRTPLGEVQVDVALVDRVARLGGAFVVDSEAHRDEHSIEVQLPFIARACPHAGIVPLLVSCRTAEACAAAGKQLGRLLREVGASGSRVLLAASSDFAHYPDEETARRVTAELMPSIVALDPEGLADREAAFRRSPIPGLACGMCGLDPVLLALAALREMGVTRGELVDEATSADVGGDPYRTVGYAAVVFFAP
jgi:MEMO1 family protein